MVMPGEFNKFITDYFRSRPWMLEEDGSFKISGLDMDDDKPAEWGEGNDPEPKTPAGYVENGQMWLDLAEWEVLENESPDRAGPLAMLAMASALLGICAKLSQDSKTD